MIDRDKDSMDIRPSFIGLAKMKMVMLFVSVLLLGDATQLGFSLPSALLWSPHHRIESSVVKYETMSPKDVAASVLSEAGWSNLMCSQDNDKSTPLDLALVFFGRELQSWDFYANKHVDKDLVNFLKVSLTRSNFSLAFPYMADSEEKETVPNSLLSVFSQTCEKASDVVFSDSCSLSAKNSLKLPNLESVNDFASSVEERAKVVVLCHDGSNSESETFSKLVNSMDQSGKRYSVLYVSDPVKPIQSPSHREVERFLAEGSNATGCGEVCKIKSSLLEGLFVGIVLLLILISGICCMMGIDTPTRFEAPQDS